MPLRITDAKTDVAVLNKWAEGIEKQLKTAHTGIQRVSNEIAVTTNIFNTAFPTIAAGTNFNKLTSGHNIKADMEVDSGAKLSYANNGIVNANQIGTIFCNTNTPDHAGEVLISQPGNKTAAWADPLVQGVNAPGSPSSTLNPVLTGAIDGTGVLHSSQTDASGATFVSVQNEPVVTIKDIDGNPVVVDSAVQVNVQQPVAITDTNNNPLQSTTGALNVFTVNAASSSGNPAAGPTGSGVPADADYLGVNIGGTLTGVTGLSLTNAKPATVAVVDASGNQITAFGGSGGNAAAGPTGSAVPADADYTGFNSGGNLVGVSTANPLPVSQQGNVTIVGTGTLAVQATLPAGQAVELLDSGGTNKASISAAGAVKVDGSAVTQPVSGTFFQATQPVSVAANVGVTQQTTPWTIQGDSASGAAKAGNPIQIGGVFNTTQPTVTTGQTVEAQITARGAQIVATGVDTFNATINAALPAGTNVIGHIITDSGSVTNATLSAETTKVIGTVNQGTSPWVVSGAVTTSGTATVIGTLTNNNAAPAATHVGALTALANAARPTWTEGDQVLLSSDLAGGLRVVGNETAPTTVLWTSATPTNTLLTQTGGGSGYGCMLLTIQTDSNVTGGVVSFLANVANENSSIQGTRQKLGSDQLYDATHTHTLAASEIWNYFFTGGFNTFQVNLDSAITGTGTASLSVRATYPSVPGPTTVGQSNATKLNATVTFSAPQHTIVDSGTITAVTAITNALPAGTNVIGHVITDSGSVTNATLSAETTKVIGTVNQGTSPWVVSCPTDIEVVQDTAADLLATVSIAAAQTLATITTVGTVTTITNPVAVTSDGTFEVVQDTAADFNATVVGNGTFAVQAAITAASGSIASGALASGSVVDGAIVTLGSKADAKSTATDTTAVTIMQVLKEISAMEQAPASRAVTNAGTFATQSAITAASGAIASGALAAGSIASGAIASGAVASGAVASGAFASGSVSDGAVVTLGAKADAANAATDTTAISVMSVLKEISKMAQAPASTPVTGTFYQATQPVSIADAGGVEVVQDTAADLLCTASLAAGTNVIGHVIVDSGTITTVSTVSAVTGDVEVVQDTAGDLKVSITGNAGGVMDAAGQNAASPANELLVAGQFNTTPTTISSGNVSPMQLDSVGRHLVRPIGLITVQTAGNPAAGSGGVILFTVPAGKIWKLLGLRVNLVTDANAGNRTVYFDIDPSGASQHYFEMVANFTQPASQTAVYSVVPGGISLGTVIGTIQRGTIATGTNILMPAGTTITMNIDTVKAGDQISNISGVFEEFVSA